QGGEREIAKSLKVDLDRDPIPVDDMERAMVLLGPIPEEDAAEHDGDEDSQKHPLQLLAARFRRRNRSQSARVFLEAGIQLPGALDRFLDLPAPPTIGVRG